LVIYYGFIIIFYNRLNNKEKYNIYLKDLPNEIYDSFKLHYNNRTKVKLTNINKCLNILEDFKEIKDELCYLHLHMHLESFLFFFTIFKN
jgi:hypothetical protein